MLFGLKNASTTFQRAIDNVLKDLQNKICLIYEGSLKSFELEHEDDVTHHKYSDNLTAPALKDTNKNFRHIRC